ncbi:IDEAL domain-containing protein [Aquibacillus halophilus]|uniref:IDEAL domain-containing protein n=1 Tax=Aquibacillus halophilus TaxID=930132 RepID=A0A6A8DFV1_9BACI|nr:IDEAL domain-containing protein [Aquibacillus halophilus]MRH44513.1 IDEAL domain-containing protein [Aquibacillus halophilus]
MEVNKKLNLSVGDWVKGVSKNGELVHGYLESFQPNNSKVVLKVVVSDNERIIGNTVRFDEQDIEKIDTTFKNTEKQLEDLIDLALSTRDHSWFMELSTELKAYKQDDNTSSKTKKRSKNNGKLRNKSF